MVWLRRSVILTLIPASLGLVVGCGARSDILGEGDCKSLGTCECRNQSDCPSTMQCINGTCRAPIDPSDLLGFGEICQADMQCASGFCIPNARGDAKVCTRLCTGTCPDQWECKVRVGTPSVNLCAQRVNRLCNDCSVDGHCNPAFGDYCLTLPDGTQGCGLDCNFDTCPNGYSCKTVEIHGSSARQCVPDISTCTCSSRSVGLSRPCENKNAFGVCQGLSTCQQDGKWSECEGKTPSLEVCNGEDDNCNGLVDHNDPGVDTAGLPPTPAYPACSVGTGQGCSGTWMCQQADSGFAWTCISPDMQEEVCDGRDNDCNGIVDDPFVDEQGRYVHVNNCGRCGIDCEKVITHAAVDKEGKVQPGAVTCEPAGDSAICVAHRCEPGFYPFPKENPRSCRPLPSPQCRPCTTSADCSVPQDACVKLGIDVLPACLQACGVDALYPGCTGEIGAQGCCPDYAVCQEHEGKLVCVPRGNTCECNENHEGVVRSCVYTGAGGAKCEGTVTCNPDSNDVYQWSECTTVGTTDEVCDGIDNNCDGKSDENFINQKGSGTYDVDEHCGKCHNDCTALWSKTIQHAVGGCVVRNKAPKCEIVACTGETIGGGGLCHEDADCPAGYTCAPPYYQCVRRCQSSGECPTGSTCDNHWCTVNCTKDADCVAKYGMGSKCSARSVCEISYRFHNVDKKESNGCECPEGITGVDDEPEIFPEYPEAGASYVDRDCDGIDGQAKASLYVWQGTTKSLGTQENPYATIKEAMDAFDPSKHRHILVASGQYQEAVILKEGVGLYGGYSPSFYTRDIVGYPTLLLGPEPVSSEPNPPAGTVNAASIRTRRTVVAGFAIYGQNVPQRAANGAAGLSSYAVHIKDSTRQLVLANNLIFAGRGGDGGHGKQGATGQSGAAGTAGRPSVECTNASCSGQSQPGGPGGINQFCDGSSRGTAGGAASGNRHKQLYSEPLGLNGRGGTNARYNSDSHPQFQHLCKYDCTIESDPNGLDAKPGPNGVVGDPGKGCANAVGGIIEGLWVAGQASNGQAGTAGKGGGGGGGGGCVINETPVTCTVGQRLGDLGATGGGGGAGGCGGAGGGRGGAGGGSFGIFVAFGSSPASVPVISGNILYLGQGGAGGDGAVGGHGGMGGIGGVGGIAKGAAWCAGPGGKGGRGGDGGPGGGAGGGCGGVAFSIAGNYIGSADYQTRNVFVQPAGAQGGPAGLGGASPAGPANHGTPGLAGQSGVFHAF